MSFIQFRDFRLDLARRQLLDGERPLKRGARAFDVLRLLAERAPEPVSKSELLDIVWPGLVVEENNLQVQVATLRKLLGAHAIVTIPGRGYSFTLPRATDAANAVDGSQTMTPTATPTDRAIATDGAAVAAPSPHALIGRDADLQAVFGLLDRHRLVAITGAGGIGKTRLARAEFDARKGGFAGGACFIELAPLADPVLVAPTIAGALQISVGPNKATLQAMVSLLRDTRMLLVLDNCEHVLAATAECVDAVLRECPGVCLLVTSQEPLHAEGEVTYRLGPLPVDLSQSNGGAVRLFTTRVSAVDARRKFDDAALVIAADICRRLDGIPLAIELAAARVPLIGLEGLRARLDERFNILTGGARTVLRRHQTLRATLEWSHGLLSGDEQVVFRRLGVFAGGFTLELAQDVASDERIDRWTLLDLMGHLVDRSLVIARTPEPDAQPRYDLLETTRAYALEHLAAAGETEALLRRHSHALIDALEPLERMAHTATPPANDIWTVAVGGGFDNIRVALDWAVRADPTLARKIYGLSRRGWFVLGLQSEALRLGLALLPHPADHPPLDQARFWLTLAMSGERSNRSEPLQAGLDAARLYGELGERVAQLDALTYVLHMAALRRDADIAESVLRQANSLLTPATPPLARGNLCAAEAMAHVMWERDREALAAIERQKAAYKHVRGKAPLRLRDRLCPRVAGRIRPCCTAAGANHPGPSTRTCVGRQYWSGA